MNMFKNAGGFTLVELIVVIAILAILAGVAVPAYSGYISSANKAGDITALSAVKTACTAAWATEGEVTSIEVTAEDGEISEVKINGSTILYSTVEGASVEESDFDLYLAEVPELDFFKDGASWTAAAGEWTAVEADD